jgi:hypothetical protein
MYNLGSGQLAPWSSNRTYAEYHLYFEWETHDVLV